ncbi:MAG: BACON domain-containing protein, partial [Lachnospiraceae bacterium]|nr:BACON domain-containing protein [Lachnospiraceae bacterium]
MSKASFLSIFFLAIGMQAMVACGSDNNDSPDTPQTSVSVTVSPDAITLSHEAASTQLSVTADADWAISTDADWVTLRPSGGIKNVRTDVQISVKANDTMDERNASINIVSGGKTVKTVALTQGYVMKATSSVSSLTMGGQE